MRSVNIALVTIVASMLAASLAIRLAAWLNTDKSIHENRTDSVLIADASSLDIGSVHEDEKYVHRFKVKNTSSLPIVLDSIATSCDCLNVSPETPIKFDAYQEKWLTATLNLAVGGSEGINSSRPFGARINGRYMIRNEKPREFECWITGNVYRAITIIPETIDAGLISDRLSNIKIQVKVKAASNVNVIEWIDHEKWLVWKQKNANPSESNEKYYEIANSSRLLRGKFLDQIQLRGYDYNGNQVCKSKLVLSGEVVSDVQAYPNEFQLGYRGIESVVKESFQLKSLTNKNYSIKRITSTGSIVITRNEQLDDVYEAKVTVERATQHVSKVTFVVGFDDGNEDTVDVLFRCNGTKLD